MRLVESRLFWWWREKLTEAAWRAADWLDARYPRGMRIDCSICPRGFCSAHRPTEMEWRLLQSQWEHGKFMWDAGRDDLAKSMRGTAVNNGGGITFTASTPATHGGGGEG